MLNTLCLAKMFRYLYKDDLHRSKKSVEREKINIL